MHRESQMKLIISSHNLPEETPEEKEARVYRDQRDNDGLGVDHLKQPFSPVYTTNSLKNKVIKLLEKFHDFAKQNNINYVAGPELTLGIMKNKQLIPWMDGLNIWVSESDLEVIYDEMMSQDKKWCVKRLSNRELGISFMENECTWPYLLVSTYNISELKVYVIYRGLHETKEVAIGFMADFFPTRITSIHGIHIRIAKSPEKMLETIFGDWKNTCRSSSYDYRRLQRNPVIHEIPCGNIITVKEDLFDNTWVINLTRRRDRMFVTRKRLEALDIHAKRWDAVDAQELPFKTVYSQMDGMKRKNGEVACYLSHYSLWEYLYKINVPYALIFEDDILFPPDVSKENILKVTSESPGFDMILLGHDYDNRVPFSEPASQTGTGLYLHAYIVSRPGLKSLIEYLKPKYMTAIDLVTRDFCINNMCFLAHSATPVISTRGEGLVYQDDALGSDIRQRGTVIGA